MSELEWLQRTLIDPGLLAPARLEAWLRDWRKETSLLRHLVALGVLDSAAARTVAAVVQGYVQMPPATALHLFRVAETDVPADMSPRTGAQTREEPAPAAISAPVSKDSAAGHATKPTASATASPPALPAAPARPTATASTTASPPALPAATARPTAPAPERPISAGSSSPAIRAAVDAALGSSGSGARPRWPTAGERFAGLELQRLLDSGPDHAIYRAHRGHQRVLLKLLRSGEAAAQRTAYARLNHPAIVPLLAAGTVDGLGYLVFADHASLGLDEYTALAGPLGPERVVRIGVTAAEALAAAVEVGVVHGDLAPGRLLVCSSDARVELIDFKAPISGDPGAPVPAHRAPEQHAGAPASARSDMYSLGVALHLAATGHVPTSPGLRAPLAGLPPALSGVIGLLLRTQPERRPTSWAQVSSALLATRAGLDYGPVATPASRPSR